MATFSISNSLLHNWEEMCPLVFKARHFDKMQSAQFMPTPDMRWGSIFETLAIGSGVGGEVTEPTDKEKGSVYWPRVIQQAKKVRDYLRKFKLTVIERQKYYYTVIEDQEGNAIPIMGGFDLLCQKQDGTYVIIDIKLTGDTDNDFGKYSWGSPEKMDLSQSIHYTMIFEKIHGKPCEFQYWVFDKGVEMKEEILDVKIGDIARHSHIQRISKAYHEIIFSLSMDQWSYKNEYRKCSVCPVKCKNERVLPEVKIVNLY